MDLVLPGLAAADRLRARQRRWPCGRALRLLAGPAVAFVLLVANAPAASAHAYLTSSQPGNGAILTTAPTRAVLQFNVPVIVNLSGASLLDRSGHAVIGAGVVRANNSDLATNNQLVVQFPALAKGGYRLTYQAWDSIDLHKSGGSIDFGIGEAAAFATDSSSASRPSYIETGTRWLELLGIALLIGVVTVWLGIMPGLGRRPRTEALDAALTNIGHDLLRLAGLGCKFVVAGKVGQFGVALAALAPHSTRPLSQEVQTILVGSRFGLLWLVGTGLAVALLVTIGALLSRQGGGHRLPTVMLSATTLGLIAMYAQSSHGSNQRGFNAVQVAFRVAHLTAAGVWVGGLTVLVALFVADPRRRSARRTLVLAAFRQYGSLGIVAVGTLGATGLVLAGKGVASPEALVTTTYGKTLMAKLIAVAAVLVMGLRHHRLVSRTLGSAPSDGEAMGQMSARKSLAFEITGMVVVLWGAAALGATAPAPQASQTRGATNVSAPILGTDTTTKVDDLSVRVSMTPGRTGANTLFIQLHGTPSMPFRSVTSVVATTSQPGQRPRSFTGTFTGRGRYTFPKVTMDAGGQVHVGVILVRSPGPNAPVSLDWPVAPAAPIGRGLPTTSWVPVLDLLAATVAALVVIWAVAGVVRRRRAISSGPVRRGDPDRTAELVAPDEGLRSDGLRREGIPAPPAVSVPGPRGGP